MRRRWTVLALFLPLLLASCAGPPIAPERPRPALVRLQPSGYPDFIDKKDTASLSESVGYSLEYLSKLPKDTLIDYGEDHVPVQALMGSLVSFSKFLASDPSPEEVRKYVVENFEVYAAPGRGGDRPVLFTGYFTPELEARRQRDDTFRYPIYKLPEDLVVADLGLFDHRFEGEKAVGVVKDGEFLPYYSRREIDDDGGIAGRGLEIAWCSDPIGIFFLQIQGSGTLVFEDGTTKHINYAGANGRPYRSIGKLLIAQGKATDQEMSLDWLRAYLVSHPAEARQIMDYNESYVFFKMEDRGPYGTFEVPVTGERSIATDKDCFPPCAPAFIETEVPAFDRDGKLTGWEPYEGFVMNQDTGGAINGPGRVDIYFGAGKLAERRAGYMNRVGRLYFLAPKASLCRSSGQPAPASP